METIIRKYLNISSTSLKIFLFKLDTSHLGFFILAGAHIIAVTYDQYEWASYGPDLIG